MKSQSHPHREVNCQSKEKVEVTIFCKYFAKMLNSGQSLIPEEFPIPPKRMASQTNQKLKRWSKMIKDSLNNSSSKSSNRKSLKERLTEADLAVFLRERRAVSESRFRIWDRISGLEREDKQTDESKVDFGSGISAGNLSSLKERFERSLSPDLKSPKLVKSFEKNGSLLRVKSDNTETNSTSPESGDDGKKGKKKRKNKDKKPDGIRKSKKKHSTCTACNSDQEHKEKKRIKKEMKKKKKIQKENKNPESNPAFEPPQSRFFQSLLLRDEEIIETQIRKSRPAKRHPVVRNRTTPTLNPYLKERKAVTESIFKRYSLADDTATTIPGFGRNDFYDIRSKYANGNAPLATFPRSISNLEKRSGYSSLHQRSRTTSPGRPESAMSAKSAKSTTSVVDHEEYRNYILESLHSKDKNPRFQQLQSYYNLLGNYETFSKSNTITFKVTFNTINI